MTPDVVVDVGNSRMKWGRVSGGRVAEVAAFGHDDPSGWERHLHQWQLGAASRWVLAGVVPGVLRRFQEWLAARGVTSAAITSGMFDESGPFDLVTAVDIREPERIGVDRLVTAYAAWKRAPEGSPVVAVNVGTAVTIDFVESFGLFRGGVILPGPRLMARSLHEHTALLPEVAINPEPPHRVWGDDTEAAIGLGIAYAVVGAAERLVRKWDALHDTPPAVFATGGEVGYFNRLMFALPLGAFEIDPTLTLDGIRIAAEALP